MSKSMKFPLPVMGVDVRSHETSLVSGAVRRAVNVDVDRDGHPARRTGYTKRLARSDMHSVWYAPQRGWTFVATGRTVNRLDPNTYALTPLLDLGSDAPVSYTEYNGNVYFTNRTAIGWLPSNSMTARRVGVPAPATSPTLAPSASGKLLKGKYGVTIALVDDRGEEGPTAPLQTIELAADGGITLANLPVIDGWFVAIYLTTTDGEVLREAARIPAVFATYTVAEVSAGGTPGTFGSAPLPPGEFIAWQSGRLFTAIDSTLTFSEPLRPHLCDMAHNRIPFSGWISMVASVGSGLYIGDSRGVWFLAGTDVDGSKLVYASHHRAVKGSAVIIQPGHLPEKLVQADTPVALWLTSAGYMVGTPDGRVVELNSDRLLLPTGMTARSAFLTRGGRKQVVSTVNSAGTASSGTAADSVIG